MLDASEDRDIIDAMRVSLRRYKALQAIGFTERCNLVAASITTDPRPWPVQTLSETIGYSRASVRETLNDFKLAGLALQKQGQGWVCTPFGLRVFTRVYSEATEIGLEKRKGYSDELLDTLVKLNRPGMARRFRIPRGPVL